MRNALEYSFSSLQSEHGELETLFDAHQRALLARDLEAAIATLATFRTVLAGHIQYEESILLPLYAKKGAETPGGTLRIFQAEHEKLLAVAETLRRRAEALDSSGDALGSILSLLDEEALFKGLFHHHSLREQNLLFPRLDACTTGTERKEALGARL